MINVNKTQVDYDCFLEALPNLENIEGSRIFVQILDANNSAKLPKIRKEIPSQKTDVNFLKKKNSFFLDQKLRLSYYNMNDKHLLAFNSESIDFTYGSNFNDLDKHLENNQQVVMNDCDNDGIFFEDDFLRIGEAIINVSNEILK